MLKGSSVSLMALAVGMAVAAPAAAADAGYTAVLVAGDSIVGGDMYVQPWDGEKYPVKSARDGGLQTAAVFKLPPIADWLDRPSAGPVVDVATGKCLGTSLSAPSPTPGTLPVQLQDCNGTPMQTWYFRFYDESRASFIMTDNTMQNGLGVNNIVAGRGEDMGWPIYEPQYPASGTLYVVPAPTWTGGGTWPAKPTVYKLLQPRENLKPLE